MKKFLLSCCLIIIPFSLFAAPEGDDSARTIVKFGFAERLRMETWDNVLSMSKTANLGQTYSRAKSSFTMQVFPLSNLEFMVRLTNEFKYFFSPSKTDFNSDEIVFDQLYLKWKNDAVIPGTLTLGRQNIMLGEGFLFGDGGPLDGSRTFFFNAARFDAQLDAKNTLTFFYNFETPKDVQLPIVHNQNKYIVEQPEQGVGLYYQGKHGETDLQAYGIFKHISEWNGTLPESRITTVGARINQPLPASFSVIAEASYQFGTRGTMDRKAMGGYANLEYRPQPSEYFFIPKYISVGGIYLSGDDPATTDKHEAWDPLFSRFPKWSELSVFSLQLETGPGYWSNYASINTKWQFPLGGDFTYQFEYHYLTAPQPLKYLPSTEKLMSKNSGIRGRLFINKLSYKINPRVTGYMLWEGLVPGNAYAVGASKSSWVRIEMMYTI